MILLLAFQVVLCLDFTTLQLQVFCLHVKQILEDLGGIQLTTKVRQINLSMARFVKGFKTLFQELTYLVWTLSFRLIDSFIIV